MDIQADRNRPIRKPTLKHQRVEATTNNKINNGHTSKQKRTHWEKNKKRNATTKHNTQNNGNTSKQKKDHTRNKHKKSMDKHTIKQQKHGPTSKQKRAQWEINAKTTMERNIK